MKRVRLIGRILYITLHQSKTRQRSGWTYQEQYQERLVVSYTSKRTNHILCMSDLHRLISHKESTVISETDSIYCKARCRTANLLQVSSRQVFRSSYQKIRHSSICTKILLRHLLNLHQLFTQTCS